MTRIDVLWVETLDPVKNAHRLSQDELSSLLSQYFRLFAAPHSMFYQLDKQHRKLCHLLMKDIDASHLHF